MNKIWINKEKGSDKIIALGSDRIFKISPKDESIFQYANDIENEIIAKSVFAIPFTHIRTIHLQEGRKYIQVFFGKESEEHFRVNDVNKLVEIFKYLKENIPRTTYNYEQYSALKAGKKPLIAVTVVFILFVWAMNWAIKIQMGYEYELVGNGVSISGIVLGLASLGVVNVILIFSTLLGIGLYSMIRKMKNRPTVHEISFNR